jgi:hypothetical protein
LPSTFRQIKTAEYNSIVKNYGEYMEWLFDKEAMLEAAICYFPEYFTEPTVEQINHIGELKYTDYCDLQASLRKKLSGLDFGEPLFKNECVLQAYGRTLQVLHIMHKFESLFTSIGKGQVEDSAFDFVKKYGEYGAVLSLVDAYQLSIKDVDKFSAYQVFINLDYLSGKNEAEKINKQLRGSMTTP